MDFTKIKAALITLFVTVFLVLTVVFALAYPKAFEYVFLSIISIGFIVLIYNLILLIID